MYEPTEQVGDAGPGTTQIRGRLQICGPDDTTLLIEPYHPGNRWRHCFLGALWVSRRLTSAFVVNGAMVGVTAVVLTLGFVFMAKPEDRLMYVVSFALRILGGCLGGLTAQRSSARYAAHAVSH